MILKRQLDERLGEILIRNGNISDEQLGKALDLQKREGGLLGEVLSKLGYVKELEIVQALTAQYGFPYIPLENYELNKKCAEIVSEDLARQHNLVPLDVIGGLLTVAMSNPLNKKSIEETESLTGKKIQIFISTASSINDSINELYRKEE